MKRLIPILSLSLITAQAETFTFNPVMDSPDLRGASQSGEVTFTWNGGGHLEQWQGETNGWQMVTTESPFKVPAEGVGLFRAIDPWNGGRKVSVTIPKSYTDDPSIPIPVVVVLHGYHTSNYMGALRYAALSESKRFIHVQPNGLRDESGNLFWNATDTCCDYDDAGMDDASFLLALVEGIAARYNVDRQRIYFLGHSNGGAMANRMACQHADLVAGIVNIGGFNYLDSSLCQPSEPVHTLHIGGSNDPIYKGETMRNGRTRPGLLTTVESWVTLNGHDTKIEEEEETLDLENLPGMDTKITQFTGGAAGGSVELWTTVGGGHTPSVRASGSSSEFAIKTIDWLFAHPKRSKTPITITSDNNRSCEEDGCEEIRQHVAEQPLADGAAYRVFFQESGTGTTIGDDVGEYAYDVFTTEIPGLPDPVPFRAVATIIMTTADGDKGYWKQETNFLPNNRSSFTATLIRGTGNLAGARAKVSAVASREDVGSPWTYEAKGWRQ